MKKKIAKILKEEWNYRQEPLIFSCDNIELTFRQETALTGSFSVRGRDGGEIDGYVYCVDCRMQLSEPHFQGSEAEITYSFDGSNLEWGDVVEGELWVVSSGGEYTIPFQATRKKKAVLSSMGEIRNLFHFTNLARTNWEEAAALFFSEEFEDLLAGADQNYREIYRGFSGRRKDQNMEEFLQAIHKKKPVEYRLDQEVLEIGDMEAPRQEVFLLERKGWGYPYLTVETEGDFLKTDKTVIREADFLGNVCRIEVVIDPSRMHAGKNWGRILLTHTCGQLEGVIYGRKPSVLKGRRQRHEIRKLTGKLTRLYVEFRSKKMEPSAWREQTKQLLEDLTDLDERNPVSKLYFAHLYITEEKFHEGKWLLDRVRKDVGLQEDPVLYAYYLYLTTLHSENEENRKQAAGIVEDLFYREGNHWQIAWLMLYLKGEPNHQPAKKWNFLMECFRRGCTSPVLYLEAAALLNLQPMLLMQLSEIELRILRFGEKQGMLRREVKNVVQYLALRQKEYSHSLFCLLASLCGKENDEAMLQSLCSLLMKGGRTDRDSFYWYEKAVMANLRLTRLYEYYMMSLDRKKTIQIPRMVLLYFSYQSSMNYEYTAYLYHYIHSHFSPGYSETGSDTREQPEEMQELYLTYAPAMERYTLKQLYSEKINSSLAYLYEHVLGERMMTPDNALALVKVLFLREITVTDKKAEKAVVIHKCLKQEISAPFSEGVAQLPMYGGEYTLFLEDGEGNRRLPEGDCHVRPYLPVSDMAEVIRPYIREDLGYAVYCCCNDGWISVREDNEELLYYLSRCEALTEEFRREIRGRLLEYYFESDRIDRLDLFLEECLPGSVKKEDRQSLIRYLTARTMYEKAYLFLQEYGTEAMNPKMLMRVCSRLMEQKSVTEEAAMTWFTYTAFQKRKYNQTILEYLIRYFTGSTRRMQEVFQAAVDFEVEAYPMAERIMLQMLYSEEIPGNADMIFKAYVAGGGKSGLEVAFLSYSAREYLRHDRSMDKHLMGAVARACRRGSQLPLSVKLAWLKYHAEGEQAGRETPDPEVLSEFLTEVALRRQIYLPFLKKYEAYPGMEVLADKTLLSYRSDAGGNVVLHYRYGEEDYYRREPMREVFDGIFSKHFTLFYGEQMQYYITEEQENQEQLTENGVLGEKERQEKPGKSRYHMVNEMAVGSRLKDYRLVDEILEEYWKTEYITDEVFKPW